MNRESLRNLYDKLTGLVEKLPGGLQKPILSELLPIRELFLDQRPPKIVLVGGAKSMTVPRWLHGMSGDPVETHEAVGGWRKYCIPERGSVEILDARATTPDQAFDAATQTAVPDLVVFVLGSEEVNDAALLRSAVERANAADAKCDAAVPLVGLVVGIGAEAALESFSAILHSEATFSRRRLGGFAASGSAFPEVAEKVCALLPNAAKLEFARLTMAQEAQKQIACTLLNSFTAACGVIGVQPIPLADLPILLTLQSLMVGAIVYVSGRQASPRLIAEFGGAMGVNVGLGFAFREGARALVRIVPIWGNAVSGVVAGAGTYAIGRSAIAYFIEDLPVQEARRLMSSLAPKLQSAKTKALGVFRK